MGKVLGGLLSVVGLGGGAKAPEVAPAAAAPVPTTATDQTTADQKTAKTARAALYATDGGVTGQELDPSQVKKRETLFGN